MADDRNFDARAFRGALSRFATGVAIVLARAPDGQLAGMTVNSFASVSLDPPLVLWSMQHGSASAPIYRAAAGFTISLLSADQEHVARRCARTDVSKLDTVTLIDGGHGIPYLADAAAWFDCRTWAIHPGGDHDILIGRVTAFGQRPGPTLLFQDGRFRRSDA